MAIYRANLGLLDENWEEIQYHGYQRMPVILEGTYDHLVNLNEVVFPIVKEGSPIVVGAALYTIEGLLIIKAGNTSKLYVRPYDTVKFKKDTITIDLGKPMSHMIDWLWRLDT